MTISEREEWHKFLDWLSNLDNNFPEWFDEEMSLHECKLLWKEKINNENQ